MTQASERTATLSALVAEEVRALLARRRMSGRQLATLLSVSPSWVSYRLTGVQAIDLNDLNRIAKALDVGVHELLPSPEVTATAADPPAMARYIPLPVWTTDRGRAPNNRPSGPSGSTRPGPGRRTARVPRGRRPSTD